MVSIPTAAQFLYFRYHSEKCFELPIYIPLEKLIKSAKNRIASQTTHIYPLVYRNHICSDIKSFMGENKFSQLLRPIKCLWANVCGIFFEKIWIYRYFNYTRSFSLSDLQKIIYKSYASQFSSHQIVPGYKIQVFIVLGFTTLYSVLRILIGPIIIMINKKLPKKYFLW